MFLKRFLKRILPKKRVTRYRITKQLGYPVNIDSPETFNEKIQWLKLNYKKDKLTRCADKVAVRDYVATMIGDKYLIPIFKVYNTYKEINFEELPEEFALKAAHGSKWNVICRNKKELDQAQFKKDVKKWGNSNIFWYGYEYAYKNIPPRFICEHLILDYNNSIPVDYKIFCFNGKPKFVQVDVDRYTGHRRVLYDTQWNRQPFEFAIESFPKDIPRPSTLDEMLHVATILSQGFPFVRIDLYDSRDKVYFGEMTFYPEEGAGRFKPQKWDRILGDYLSLP